MNASAQAIVFYFGYFLFNSGNIFLSLELVSFLIALFVFTCVSFHFSSPVCPQCLATKM